MLCTGTTPTGRYVLPVPRTEKFNRSMMRSRSNLLLWKKRNIIFYLQGDNRVYWDWHRNFNLWTGANSDPIRFRMFAAIFHVFCASVRTHEPQANTTHTRGVIYSVPPLPPPPKMLGYRHRFDMYLYVRLRPQTTRKLYSTPRRIIFYATTTTCYMITRAVDPLCAPYRNCLLYTSPSPRD